LVESSNSEIILAVEDLCKYFIIGSRFFSSKADVVRAVDKVSFVLRRGEIFGIVGESGCGKTTTGRAILRLIEPTSGRVIFDGIDVTGAKAKDLLKLRRRIQFMFQDPFSSLDPRMSVYRILKEPLDNLFGNIKRSKKKDLIAEALNQIGLLSEQMSRFPHEFSGGQRQRIALARALICRPELIVCDEPVSALDVSIQAQVINLLRNLRNKLNLTMIFISHDLAVVQALCDTIAVMYLGQIVEIAKKKEIYNNPVHPYTRALLSAVPVPDPILEKRRKRVVLSGDVPSPINIPTGCCFQPRCPEASDDCKHTKQKLININTGHKVACYLQAG